MDNNLYHSSSLKLFVCCSNYCRWPNINVPVNAVLSVLVIETVELKLLTVMMVHSATIRLNLKFMGLEHVVWSLDIAANDIAHVLQQHISNLAIFKTFIKNNK